MNALTNHLFQSTVFATLAAFAALALRNNHAALRHRLWLAASLKFLVPCTLLVALGGRVPLRVPVRQVAVEQVSATFAPISVPVVPLTHATPAGMPIQTMLLTLWLFGALAIAARWFWHWTILYRAAKAATPVVLDAPVRVLSSRAKFEPGIFGAFRPVLLLPDGFATRVSPAELDAIIAHELCHIRRRDNFTSALHMIVETIFWFHPMVWWIGVKLLEERERACDEAVLRAGSEPEVYAQGIVNVCKFYLESPLACASGVSGANLRKRIAVILMQRNPMNLSWTRKTALAATALTLIAIPLAIGILHSQTLLTPPKYGYEVVSIKPSAPDAKGSNLRTGAEGGLRMENMTALSFLTFAYDLHDYQVANVPQWMKSEHFDVSFTPDTPEKAPSAAMKHSEVEALFDRQRQRMRKILKDRFALDLTEETRELPVYALVIVKGGHKLTTAAADSGHNMSANRGMISAKGANLRMLTTSLSGALGRAVINETGLDGSFDFKLEWTPDASPSIPGVPAHDAATAAADESGPSIFSALQEQLGLKLEAKKGPVPVVVIQKIQKPAEN